MRAVALNIQQNIGIVFDSGNGYRKEQMMTTPYGFGATLPVPYEEAIPRVKEALKAEGFGVLTEIDVRRTMREKLGAEMEPYIILGACNPILAHRELDTVIDDGFRHSLNPIELGKVNELRNFNHIGRNMFVFGCQLMSQPGCGGAVGTGGSHKHLYMQFLINLLESGTRILAQIGCPFREVENIFNQCGKFLPSRNSVKANLLSARSRNAAAIP
jgi:hypothetical protein